MKENEKEELPHKKSNNIYGFEIPIPKMFTFLTCHELINLLVMQQGEDVRVIDVRDKDFVGGNIRGSINLPFHSINKTEFQKYFKQKTIIFVCMYGKLRSTEAALRFINQRESEKGVYVLSNGFREFLSTIKNSNRSLSESEHPSHDHSDLLENFNSEYWDPNYYHVDDIQYTSSNQFQTDGIVFNKVKN